MALELVVMVVMVMVVVVMVMGVLDVEGSMAPRTYVDKREVPMAKSGQRCNCSTCTERSERRSCGCLCILRSYRVGFEVCARYLGAEVRGSLSRQDLPRDRTGTGLCRTKAWRRLLSCWGCNRASHSC